ncbi:helix-turn-helix protein [compost metagenome]
MKFSNTAMQFWMKQNNITEQQLSKEISNFSAIINNTRKPQASTVNRIAEIIGVSPVLLTDVAEKHGFDRTIVTGIASKVYAGRVLHGMTRKELAEVSGCSIGVITAVEEGRVQRPRWEHIRKLADSLGIARSEYSFS